MVFRIFLQLISSVTLISSRASFDDGHTLKQKSDFANSKCLSGLFGWALDLGGPGTLSRSDTLSENDTSVDGADINGGSDGTGNFHIGDEVFSTPTVAGTAPINLIWPPSVLPSPTTLDIGGYPTSLEVAWSTTATVTSGSITTVKTTVRKYIKPIFPPPLSPRGCQLLCSFARLYIALPGLHPPTMHVPSLCLLTFLCFRTSLATGITRPFRPHHVARPLDKGQYKKTSASTTFSDIKIAAADPTQEDVNGRLSSNWAGAVLEKLPGNATYTYVAATITVPTATAAPSASSSSSSSSPSSQQAASAWVGLDGDTWPSAILQTGINFFITEGKPYVEPWYEWYPDYTLDYDDFLINPGDVIVASVNVTSTREGVCRIENLTTGLSATQIVSAPSSTAILKG